MEPRPNTSCCKAITEDANSNVVWVEQNADTMRFHTTSHSTFPNAIHNTVNVHRKQIMGKARHPAVHHKRVEKLWKYRIPLNAGYSRLKPVLQQQQQLGRDTSIHPFDKQTVMIHVIERFSKI